MDDVIGEVLFAVTGEGLRARDPITAVAARLAAGADAAEIRARMRLGQIHRRSPLPGDELFQISLLEVFAAVRGECFYAAEGQEWSDAEGEAGAVPHLRAAGIGQQREGPAPPFNPTAKRRAAP